MSTAAWVIVAIAGTAAGVVYGILLARPEWSQPRGAPGLVARLLSVHAGLVIVGGTVTAAAAVRSWQLVGRQPDEHAASPLIEVSRLDGDGGLLALIVLVVVAATVGTATLLALAARFAVSASVAQRAVTCAVLGLEICLGGYGLARLATGNPSATNLLTVSNLPLAVAALVVCWPSHADRASQRWHTRER